MQTFLSSTQEALKEQYLSFAKEIIAPIACKLESHKISLVEILRDLGKRGYLAINVPAEYGGQGRSLLDFVFFVQSVSWYEPGLGLTLAQQAAVVEVLKKYGSNLVKSHYLPALAHGESFATLAFMEKGLDIGAIKTRAEKKGEQITITGKKDAVVSGEFATLLLTLVSYEPHAINKLGLLCLDTPQGGTSDSTCKVYPDSSKLGLRSAYCNDVEFNDFKVSGDKQLGFGELAHAQALYGLNVMKVVIAAAAVGLMESSLDYVVNDVRNQEQFGVPAAESQAIQWKLADMAVETTAARLHTYRAAASPESTPDNFGCLAAMSKWYASRAARFVSSEALQVISLWGLKADSPPAQFYRDAMAMEGVGGSAGLQKMILVNELHI